MIYIFQFLNRQEYAVEMKTRLFVIVKRNKYSLTLKHINK